ncbi:MAG: sialidase family protein [Methylococcaceae bacterium]
MYRTFLDKTLFKQAVGACLQKALLTGLVLMLNGCATESFLIPPASTHNAPSFPVANTGLQSIASFDVYLNQGVIHLLVAGTLKENPAQIRVRYLHSDDGGQHWTLPSDVTTTPPMPIASRGNDIQLAVTDQKILALWQAQGELPNMGPIVSAYSLDGGATWASGTNPAANNQGDQSHIDLAADRQGIFHAIWLEDPEENGYQSLRYAQSNQTGQHWEPSRTLDTSTCSCCWNTLLMSPLDELKVLYRDMEPRDMALIQSKDHGNAWQPASTVGAFHWTFNGCPHIGGALAQADTADASLHSLVWTGADSRQGLYYLRSTDNGTSWTAPFRLGNKAMHSDIAANADAQLIAVWDEMRPDGTSIFMAQSQNDGASWSSATPLSPINRLASHPRIINTAFGFLSLWTEKTSKNASQLALAFFK